LIWIKRLAPFIIIAAAVYLYVHFTSLRDDKETRLEQEYALVTAQIWVASARLRSQPEEFLRYRDSLLDEHSLTEQALLAFVRKDSSSPETLYPFSRLVQEMVDSLLDIEDSLALMAGDSLEQAAKLNRWPRTPPDSVPVFPRRK
jgi:hypothetical protein